MTGAMTGARIEAIDLHGSNRIKEILLVGITRTGDPQGFSLSKEEKTGMRIHTGTRPIKERGLLGIRKTRGKESLGLSLKKEWTAELRTLIEIKVIMVMGAGSSSSLTGAMAITDIMLIRTQILIRKRLTNHTKGNTKPCF